MKDYIPVWKIRFENRDDFNTAAHALTADDIGWSNQVIAFTTAERYERAKVTLIGLAIAKFTVEEPQ